MIIECDNERAIRYLNLAIGKIKDFGMNFKQYNVKYLGADLSNSYKINGESCIKAYPLNEFCFGYDETYNQLHILDIYKLPSGQLFASAEILSGIYGYWKIVL